MELNEKDQVSLEIILNYCAEIASAVNEYSINEKKLIDDSALRAAIAFFILQIGEIANHLSKEFQSAHPEMPWRDIINFRHRIVHEYGRVIPEILWDTVQNDIPELRAFCEEMLK